VFDEDFDFYKVLVVDRYGSQMGDTTWNTPVKKMTEAQMKIEKGCCKDDTYSVAVSGVWPKSCTAGCSFMVTPYQSKKVQNSPWTGWTVLKMDFVVPMGVMTAVFTDSKGSGAAVTVQTASFEMAVSNPKEFMESPLFESTMRTSIADTIDGIDATMIVNIRATLVNATSASTLRLAGDKLKVTFDVLIPSTYTGAPFKASSINATKLSSNIVKTAAANGMKPVTVTVDSASLVMSEAVSFGGGSNSTTAAPSILKEQTDGATPMSGLSAILVVLMTLTGSRFLA